MKNSLMLIAVVALIFLAAMPAQARTITMSNPGGIAERDIVVYWPNGTMYGYYNSSSVITIDNETDYFFTMKPVSSNLLEDPVDWLSNTAFPFVTSNVIGIFVLVVLAAYWRMK